MVLRVRKNAKVTSCNEGCEHSANSLKGEMKPVNYWRKIANNNCSRQQNLCYAFSGQIRLGITCELPNDDSNFILLPTEIK